MNVTFVRKLIKCVKDPIQALLQSATVTVSATNKVEFTTNDGRIVTPRSDAVSFLSVFFTDYVTSCEKQTLGQNTVCEIL